MSDLSFAIIPLTTLPWVALILASTAARFNVVATQINKLYLAKEKFHDDIIELQLERSRIFTNILTCLYMSLFMLLLSSFIGIIHSTVFQDFTYSQHMIVIFFSIWVFFALVSVILLIKEASIMRKVMRKKIRLIKKVK